MSRIPPVRKWCVRFYRAGTLVAESVVETINKRFARWEANERNGYIAATCDRITVSLTKG